MGLLDVIKDQLAIQNPPPDNEGEKPTFSDFAIQKFISKRLDLLERALNIEYQIKHKGVLPKEKGNYGANLEKVKIDQSEAENEVKKKAPESSSTGEEDVLDKNNMKTKKPPSQDGEYSPKSLNNFSVDPKKDAQCTFILKFKEIYTMVREMSPKVEDLSLRSKSDIEQFKEGLNFVHTFLC